jgi:hypothetical protein
MLVTGVSCTWRVPFMVLSYTCDIPGAVFPPVTALARRWSADRRFHARRGPRQAGRALLSPADRNAALAFEAALAPGGRQVAPLVFSAWDSATWNAAVAVVNSGGSAPPAPPAPCQVMSQVIVADAVNAPPGCPALELV